jgi:nucleoside-diphosphate-sugar epimerase
MRVFVTGGSGWIGSAVVPELLAAGHEVDALARSDAAAQALTAAGASVRHGSLDDLDVLSAGAAESDGVIHLAFRHDLAFTGDVGQAAEADRRAIESLGAALRASDRPLVIASGTGGLPEGADAADRLQLDPDNPLHGRMSNALATLRMGGTGVRASVVGLPPTVHGEGDTGFVPMLIATARARGASAHIGDGTNRWPAVHRSDAARLFRLAVESAPAGSGLHAVQDEGIAVRRLAEIIGRHLDVPVVSLSPAEGLEDYGFVGHVLGIDMPSSSALTRELLSWETTGPGLVDDLEAGHYFRTASA